MDNVSVGTCSWTDPALARAGWYPPGVRSAEERLRHYASRFRVVEVDATYYGLPSERNSRLWVERTEPGFTFHVKAFSLLTGHPTRTAALPPDLRPPSGTPATVRPADVPPAVADEVWQRFLGALEPLRAAGRLGALLFQFPPWFRPGRAAEEYLRECRRRCGPFPMSVEFRHPEWLADGRLERTLELLRAERLPLVCVDMAQSHPGAVPPVAATTSPELALVRFHGRNPDWPTADRVERYRHAYTAAELSEWLPRLRRLAEGSTRVHALFNTCCGDASPAAAELLARML